MTNRLDNCIRAQTLKVRRILQNAETIQFGFGGKYFSPQQKQTLIAHFWIAATPLEATYPKPTGETMEVYLQLPPGPGHIVLAPDVAWSFLNIQHLKEELSEEYFNLHPATNRFLRAWLNANAPYSKSDCRSP